MGYWQFFYFFTNRLIQNPVFQTYSKPRFSQVLDPASLGFRPTSDPNRVNAGEIDSVPPVLGGKRWAAESFYIMMICDSDLFWRDLWRAKFTKEIFLFSFEKPKNIENKNFSDILA